MQTPMTQEERFTKRIRDAIEKKTGKTPEQLREEREKRVMDVIQMKVPDRMPVYLRVGYYSTRYAGLSPSRIPRSAVFYDPAAHRDAHAMTLLEFQPDFIMMTPAPAPSGLAMEILRPTQFRWSGGPLRHDQAAQAVEPTEPIMKENEYDLFTADPGDYILRHYLPQAYEALAPLSRLPRLGSLVGATTVANASARFISPEIIPAFEALFKAGQEQAKFDEVKSDLCDIMGIAKMHDNVPGSLLSFTPFDWFTDTLRGFRGTASDMFKQPEKMLAALERTLEWHLINSDSRKATRTDKRRRVTGGGAHWGSSAYLSKKQFEKFYWPTWKKSILASIEMGWIPVLHPEGDSSDRIEHFLELPKGKAFLWNEILDVYKAKEILGGHLAFMGGVPPALLHFGSPQEVTEHCKKLIEVIGKDGGYILSCGGVEEDAKPENLKAMVDAVKKYGRYN